MSCAMPLSPVFVRSEGTRLLSKLLRWMPLGRWSASIQPSLPHRRCVMTDNVLDFDSGFRRRALLWERVVALRPEPDDPHFRLARIVFAALLGAHGARMVTGTLGACRITESVRLSEAVGLATATWIKAPASFRQGSAVVAPWPVTLEIVSATAALHPGRLRALVGRETGAHHLCCLHGNAGLIPDGEPRRYCCKCEYGLRKGPALEHDTSFYCYHCQTEHPGSRALDGCPEWWQHPPNADRPGR